MTTNASTLWDLIKDIKFAMLTTHGADGHLHSRPLTTMTRGETPQEEAGVLWFFISRTSDMARDVVRDAQVNVAYAHPGHDRYVSVAGTAALVEDRAQKQALWNKGIEAWFPGGVSDPDLALLRVDISHAHYWDVKESKLTQAFEIMRAATTHRRPDIGREGEVRGQAH